MPVAGLTRSASVERPPKPGHKLISSNLIFHPFRIQCSVTCGGLSPLLIRVTLSCVTLPLLRSRPRSGPGDAATIPIANARAPSTAAVPSGPSAARSEPATMATAPLT